MPPMPFQLPPEGYVIVDLLTPDRLASIRNLIQSQFEEVLASQTDLNDSQLPHITDYHHIASSIDHSSVWSKSSRIFDVVRFNKFSHTVLKSPNFKSLNFGYSDISDEEDLGYPNVYWRLVRPSQPKDVGPLHRDEWFWRLNNNFGEPKTSTRLKVWVSLYSSSGQNGLLVEPYSHLRDDISWTGEQRHGIEKPVLLSDPSSLKPVLLDVRPGQAVVFHDRLLHGGSVNKDPSSCRVSLEFTLLFRK